MARRSQNSHAKKLFEDVGTLFQQTAHLMEKKELSLIS